jgi:type IV secretory pathway ATPase VirB11/archaellum biosynthesis ATPase/intein/homing endonuclease
MTDEFPKIDLNPPTPPLPKFPDKTKTNVRYMLIAPYVSAHVYWNPEISEIVYELEEPLLNEDEKKYLEKLEVGVRELINVNLLVEKDLSAMLNYLDKTTKLIISELGLKVSNESYNRLFYYLYRDFIGLDEIEPLLKDYFIEDIECNGINTPVYIIHRVYRNMKTNLVFKDMDELAGFIEKLAQRCGRYVSYASPLLDGTLPDGSRVNATYTTEISSRGPTFTIRKFTKIPWTPIQLISFNTLSPEMLAYFWILLQYKSSILITGGTASGKTSLLNGIAFFIPPEARVVSIEDSVTGDAKIIVKKNEKIKIMRMGEFIKNHDNSEEVLTIDKDYKIKFAKPSSHIKHTVEKEIYEITTSTGRKIKTTKDHSLFSLSEGGLKEIKPSELKENESFIAVPRVLPLTGEKIEMINLLDHLQIFEEDFLEGEPVKRIFEKFKLKDFRIKKEKYRWWKNHNIIKISDFRKANFKFAEEELPKLRIKSKNKSSIPVLFELDKDFLEFAGLWLGDGSYDSRNKNVVIVSNVDEECREVIKRIAKRLDLKYSEMSDEGVSLRVHSTILYKFMKNVIKLDGYSDTKKIPELIFNLSNDQIKHFIRGYFSADGCIKKNEVSCASQSSELIEDMQTALLRFNIISRINDEKRKDKCINMSISNFDNINKFKEIGFLQARKNEKLLDYDKKAHHTCSDVIPLSIGQLKSLNNISKLSWPYLQGMQNIGRDYLQKIAPTNSFFNEISHSDILWDKVKKIKNLGKQKIEVYDLSMPGTEKFICNNILLHNTRELNLPRENWLPSVARMGVGGIGEIDLFDLLKESFRQNPDYVIVGEVRGKEASVLFQGMASGHSSISTLHAESVETVIRRLQTPPISLSPTLMNSLDCVAVMSHAIVNKQETRRLSKITEVVDVTAEGVAKTNTPFVWDPASDKFFFKTDSKVFEKIMMKYGLTKDELQREFRLRTKLIFEMFKRKVVDFDSVQKVINDYYKNPQAVLKAYGIV